MSENHRQFDPPTAMARLETAAREGKLSPSAASNIRKWLTEPRYARYAGQVAQHLNDGMWRQLDDVFWTVIPFGTGGRRGRMYPIGSNAINDRTIGESAAGLAAYVSRLHRGQGELSCAIAYDTRHNSRHFAELCAGVMVAAGYRVYLLEDYRSTPELSFLVRYKACSCGMMVTASHNPPSDNAVKIYWSTGGQVLPPHDQGIIEQVMAVEDIAVADFDEAVADGRVRLCKDEVDAAYLDELRRHGHPGPRNLKILYSPLHGVGASAVCPALAADGFQDVEVFGPHKEPSGDFPNVPGHVSNPENVAVFDAIIEHGRKVGADLILATDPDCDRVGCAAPLSTDRGGVWATLNGNQIGALLADYVLDQFRRGGRLSAEHYLLKTLVTTEMIRRIGEAYGVKTYGDLLVGFKWIGGAMDEKGPDRFVFGAEESHGYLVGQYVRDKDGVVACMLLAELAANLKAVGQTLHQQLDALYRRHGYHAERLMNVFMEGSEGMSRMQSLMERLRREPPRLLAGMAVVRVRDYLQGIQMGPDGASRPLEGPRGDMVFLDLAEAGNSVAVRPSGTEPKIKLYMFAHARLERPEDLEAAKRQMAQRLDMLQTDLRELADAV